MSGLNIIVLALKNLQRKPFRTGVLIAAIAALVALLIFAMSFSRGVGMGLKKASERLGADLIVTPQGTRGFAEEFLLESKNTSFYMPKDIIGRIRQIEGVDSLTPQTYLATIPGICCDVTPARIVVFDPETDFIVRPWLQKSLGRGLGKGEAIAGYGAQENFGFGLLDIQATFFDKPFKIVGALEATGTGLDNALFMTDENLTDIIASGRLPLQAGEISAIFVKLKKGLDPAYLGKVIEGEIVDVDVTARSDMGSRFLALLGDINKIFLITAAFSSILTLFLTWAIFSAITNERSREIGIMRAIGATQAAIVKLFLLEALILSIVGGLIGVAGGTSLSMVLVKNFTLIKGLSADLAISERMIISGICLFGGCAICLCGALLPVNRIKKLEPLLAIKGE